MDQVLIITGGSRGIGAATARLAAQRGYSVCVNFVRNEAAAAARGPQCDRRLAAGPSPSAPMSRWNPTSCGCSRRWIRLLGRVTALVNNAGTLERQMRVDTMDAARLTRVLATNVTGSFLCAREAVRRMSTKHGGAGGAIVNVSSGASRLGSPGEYVDYAASKGAVDTLTIGLAREVADEGIRVNAVRPGFIYTDIHASGGEPARVDRVKAFVPMQRGGTADEVARAILWLLSDEASYTTGAFIDVTGGK